MLLFFFRWFRDHFDLPPVFEYYSTRMALAAITSLLVTLFFGKHFIKKLYEWKVGDRVRSEDCPLLGELHRNKNDTPTMGGILILFSLLISLLLWMDLQSSFTLLLFLVTVVMGALGGWDDYLKLRYKNKKGIKGKAKLIVQGGLSLIIAIYLLWDPLKEFIHLGNWFIPPAAKDQATSLSLSEYALRFYIPFFKEPFFQLSGLSIFFAIFCIVFVITGTSNAVNLTDGLDGLATGTVMLAAGGFSIIAFISNNHALSKYLHILYIEESGEIAIYLAAVCGACLGFLWYNGYPAQVFMGDTGSLPLGAILGLSAVLLRRELLLALIGGLFVLEALSVILQVSSFKFRKKKRVFLCAPLHHHFEYKGWSETKVVVRFWIVGLLLAIIGVASLKFQ